MRFVIFFLSLVAVLNASDFYAYYTSHDSGEPFEKVSRTGEYADVVVNIGKAQGQLVFWRGSSYLPYWRTPSGKWFLNELVGRSGDGDDRRPDRVNAFSHVQVIHDTPEQILVQWRYLPRFESGNPKGGVKATAFVEELFEIRPDATVVRTVRQGTERLQDWTDPKNRTVEFLRLSPAGIHLIRTTAPAKSTVARRIDGNPLRAGRVAGVLREWSFDEGVGESTQEAATKTASRIAGGAIMWRGGVSGTALEFDGYNTVVQLPAAAAPDVRRGLTLEGWVAIAAYPWNWVPVVQQGDDAGYFLGVNAQGNPGLRLGTNAGLEELVSTQHLERNRWYHLAASWNPVNGDMAIYVDGKLAGTRIATGALKPTADPIKIGKGMDRRPTGAVRASTFSASYSFEGLIDEVRIYGSALLPGQVADAYEKVKPAGQVITNPDLEVRRLPELRSTASFGAHHTNLKFYEAWDNLWRFGQYPDVVVSFDALPTHFVFWRGVSYIPMLVNDKGQWYSNEFNETWNRSGGQGCMEPMSDKENFEDHVRVIENSPARVVVHWRFPLKDVLHVHANYHPDTGWYDVADWYYTIYPDGMAVKRMHLWTDGPRNHEFQESMVILGPGQHPEQVVEKDPTIIMANQKGEVRNYSWITAPPKMDIGDSKIQVVNFRSDFDPVTIGDFEKGESYSGEVTPYSVFPSWNHWPVAQIPSDGRYAGFPDRPAHSSLSHVTVPTYRSVEGERGYYEKLLLEGMSALPPAQLATVARSWLNPPAVTALQGATTTGFDPAERAYVFTATAKDLSFTLDASPGRPAWNPALVVNGWNTGEPATLRVDGATARQGVVRDTAGRQKLVVWIDQRTEKPVTIRLSGAQPLAPESPAAPGRR